MRLSEQQRKMLKSLHEDGEPTDYAEFANRSGSSALGWGNRERVIKALQDRNLIDDDLKLTDAGRAEL